MGSCAGKANSANVVSAHIQPVDPRDPNIHHHDNHAAVNHNENQQQVSQPNKYQEAQNPHNHNNPNQYTVQHLEAQNQYQQPQPQSENSNYTTKVEEKPKNSANQGDDDLDEDAFASQLKNKEAPKTTTEKKKENNLSNDAFALNFPANQFISNDNTKKEAKVIEDNKRYQSKNKEKNVRNIIDNPDEMEQSFSSHGEARNINGQGDDDDFDFAENGKQNSHRHIETHHKNQQSLSNNAFHEQQKQPNRASLTESASPSSGNIKNKTPEKEKIIEVQLSHPNVKTQHYEEQHERHEPLHVEEKREIIHHEPTYVQEKKYHQEEEEPVHYQPEKKNVEKVKSPERVLEARKEKIEEPLMEFDDPPLKIIDTPKKKEIASPQKNTVKASQEKMPWEKNSAPYEDENEIEFFDDELES